MRKNNGASDLRRLVRQRREERGLKRAIERGSRTGDVLFRADRLPAAGERVMMAGAYFRGNKTEGFGFVITPATAAGSDGFVSTVRKMLNDYDAAEAKPAVLLEQLESLCPRAVHALGAEERLVALGKICWLVTRDHLKADEHNGVMWAVEKVVS